MLREERNLQKRALSLSWENIKDCEGADADDDADDSAGDDEDDEGREEKIALLCSWENTKDLSL